MDTLYRRSPDALSANVGADIVALQRVRGFAFGMEDSTASIWRLLERPISIDALVAALLEEYEVDEDRCRGEVREFIAELERESLVERVTE